MPRKPVENASSDEPTDPGTVDGSDGPSESGASPEQVRIDGPSAFNGFLFATDVLQRFQRTTRWLGQFSKSGRIRTKTINNVVRYNVDDVTALVEEEKTQQASSDAMRAATSMAAQAEESMRRMFELTMGTNEKLFAIMQGAVDKANDQNVKLQDKLLKMQEDAENARTQEHLRQLATQDAASVKSMREKGLSALQSMMVPWFLKRMGVSSNGGVPTTTTPPGDESPPASSTTEPSATRAGSTESKNAANQGESDTDPSSGITAEQKVVLADNIVAWLKTLPPEALEKMRGAIPPEHFTPLEMLSVMVKGT